MKYEDKKKNLAAKGMPDPKVKKNVTKGDRMGVGHEIRAKAPKKVGNDMLNK